MFNFSERFNSLEDLGAVYLLLGVACNMTCRHCTQTPIKNRHDLTPCGGEPSDKVKDFLVTWSNLPWKYPENNPRRLYFWGGEPLLYWETIKRLVLEFERLGVKTTGKGRVSYRIYTNGLLLNEEVVDFCNAHDIWVIMSYDAPNPLAVRNTCPSDDICRLLLKVKKRAVNTVFNALNKDMARAFRMLEEKFPDTEITCGLINMLHDIPEDIYTFKPGEVRRAVEDLEPLARSGDKHVQRWFNILANRAIHWYKPEFKNSPYPPCHPGVVSLSVDFRGNIMRCHNDGQIIAAIDEPFEVIQQKHLELWRKLLPTDCLTCPVADMCRCICPIAVKTNDGARLKLCDVYKEYYSTARQIGMKLLREQAVTNYLQSLKKERE